MSSYPDNNVLAARFNALRFVLKRIDESERIKFEKFVHKLSRKRYKFRQTPITSVTRNNGQRGFLRLDSRHTKSFSTIGLVAECSSELGISMDEINRQLDEVPEVIYKALSEMFSDELAEYILSDYINGEDGDDYSYHKLEILKMLISYSISVSSVSKTMLILSALKDSTMRGAHSSPTKFIRIADKIGSKNLMHPVEWIVEIVD